MKLNRFIVLAGWIWLAAAGASRLNAQSFFTLHSFVYPSESPYAPLILGPDGLLYGTVSAGGTGANGTVFKVSPNGTGFTNLYNFTGGSDGAAPDAGLVLSGGILYGTTTAGGDGGNGTVFALSTNGTGFTVLHDFSAGTTNVVTGLLTNTDGADSESGLVLAGGSLFGTTYGGGTWGNGVVYTLQTNGSGFAVLRQLSAGNYDPDDYWTNGDGASPEAGLVLSGTNLYGAAYLGGANGSGTVFRLGTNGVGFTLLRTFPLSNPNTGVNAGGANPYGALILSGTNLYGTAEAGGANGNGTVFVMGTNGGGYTALKAFSATDANAGTNTDGAYPDGTLLLSGTNLYGTTSGGGFWNNGSVFVISTNGVGFVNLHNFATGSAGAVPEAGLCLSGTQLYGTASAGGTWGTGTAFSLGTNGAGYVDFCEFAGTDGVGPLGGLVLAGSNYIGTVFAGGASNSGMIYRISTNGTGYTLLRNFTTTDPNTGTNLDGANPQGDLVLAGTNVYGTTTAGGTGANGTVFVMGTNGGGFNVLWSFSAGNTNAANLLTNVDGADPEPGLTLTGTGLYGTAYAGGSWGNGAVFGLSTNGTGFFILHNLSMGNTNAAGLWTNADGASPEAGLAWSGTNFYGTTYLGGLNDNGTLFRLGTNGGGFTVLKTFSAVNTLTGTNTDGANPYATLILSGTNLYGSAENGGAGANGTLFVLGTNGGGFTVLKNFSATDPDTGTNTDGSSPDGGLVLANGMLYGSTSAGGFFGGGTLYEISTNGTGFAVLHHFYPATDGNNSDADLLLTGAVLGGTTSQGGTGGGGTVFDLNTTVTSPLLSIAGTGNNLTVAWPSPSVGFALEENTNLLGTNWVTYPGGIGDNGFSKTAGLSNTNSAAFFRLINP